MTNDNEIPTRPARLTFPLACALIGHIPIEAQGVWHGPKHVTDIPGVHGATTVTFCNQNDEEPFEVFHEIDVTFNSAHDIIVTCYTFRRGANDRFAVAETHKVHYSDPTAMHEFMQALFTTEDVTDLAKESA